ncbi:MAG: class I SAM-dependent methyltransferase [Betaproteobacteria bacterium]|nr:MAG: class I SAM-dependent methyltransferase [Betaproteobacteria bacterium]
MKGYERLADDGVVAEWFADEEFWEALYPFLFGAQRLAAGESESQAIARLTGVSGGRLLDLACGPGRHAIAFARSGFRVTAVDRSTFLLGKAATQASEVEWVKSDMRSFVREGEFDLAICMFNSLGYFEGEADNRKVLENVRRSLRPGGRFVLDLLGKEVLDRLFQATVAEAVPGVGTYMADRAWADDRGKLENRWTLTREDGRIERFFMRHWVYSADDLEAMLREAGFDAVRLFGDLSGAPYGQDAKRLIALASRPRSG